MIKTTLKIDGMMCGMCESHVNDAIRKAFPAVKKVTSSHGSRIRRSVSFSSDGFIRTTKSRAVSGVEVVLLFVSCVSWFLSCRGLHLCGGDKKA